MNRLLSTVTVVGTSLLVGAGTAQAVEIITVRSGQVGGLPGVAGQPDDVVTFLPNNPVAAPISLLPFTAADFAGAAAGPAAVVINPVSVWTPGISDPAARWINFGIFPPNPDGTPGLGWGTSGSSLYAIPYVVTTAAATVGALSLEFAVDDGLGDGVWAFGGNFDGIYSNGTPMGYFGGNFAAPTIVNMNIPLSTGLNYLYLYQRDQGAGVSGIIFSATVTIPAPGAAATLVLGGLAVARRRRR